MYRKIYFDNQTGEVILTIGGNKRLFEIPSEYDYESYDVLKERVKETIGLIRLDSGQYGQDFAECNGYRVNPETKELEFSYPDPNEPDVQQPYIKPLSESVNEQMDYLVDVDFRLSLIELGI